MNTLNGLPRVTPTNTGDAWGLKTTEKEHKSHHFVNRGIAMYKFMFFALMACAVYPDWPVEAMAASQGLIDNLQVKGIVVSQLSQ